MISLTWNIKVDLTEIENRMAITKHWGLGIEEGEGFVNGYLVTVK